MDNHTIWITIISSLLDGLASAVFAGVIIWVWQNKYTERKNKINIYFKRKQREEDLFYKNFRDAKNKMYNLFVILTNTNDHITQQQINEIVSSVQVCIDQINISRVALKKYDTNINNIMRKYNEFANVFMRSIKLMDTMTQEEITKANNELIKLKDGILFEIENVDKLYFSNKF